MIHVNGYEGASVVVVCDAPPTKCYDEGRMMTPPTMKVFSREMSRLGLGPSDFVFLNCSPPIPEEAAGSDKRTNEFLDLHRAEFLERLEEQLHSAKAIIYLGKHAGKQLLGRAVKITQERGQIHERKVCGQTIPVLPLYSPSYVRTRPEVEEIFQTDTQLLGALRDADWDLEAYQSSRLNGNYRWCMDLQFLLDDPPAAIRAALVGQGGRHRRSSGHRLLEQPGVAGGVQPTLPGAYAPHTHEAHSPTA